MLWESRLRTERPTSDHASLAVHFENGALATVRASFCVDDGEPYPDRISLEFERGRITRWMRRERHPDMSRDVAELELHLPGGEKQRFTTHRGDYAGWYDWAGFRDAVREGHGTPEEYCRKILHGLRLVDAMKSSSLSGLPERVHPVDFNLPD